MKHENTEKFAIQAQEKNPLKEIRNDFYIPLDHHDKKSIYLCGNSLGPMPKKAKRMIDNTMNAWATLGVEGHMEGGNPWLPIHEKYMAPMAHVVGAHEHEVNIMNSLTVNLHLMMVSFYRPTKQRHKILMLSDEFPSDIYAATSQIELHGYDPNNALLFISPRKGERTVRNEDVCQFLDEKGSEIAFVLLGNTNYVTGQFFDHKLIAKTAKAKGCMVCIDAAHGVGNVPLDLHDSNIDCAVWCTYKYLNGGPGGIGGVYIHEKYHNDPKILRLAGWWGHNKEDRFKMRKKYIPIPTVEGWQISNPPVLSTVPVYASLEIYEKVGMDAFRKQSKLMTAYFEFLINDIGNDTINIITPSDPEQRGCQLSIQVKGANKDLYTDLMKHKEIICDWREPDIIRVSINPLYNTYMEAYDFTQRLTTLLNS